MVETRRCLGSRAFFTYERLVGCDELRSRRHAEFERQCPARALERTKPFDAAAGSLIRHEQERPSSLAHGMRCDERLDIADHIGRRPARRAPPPSVPRSPTAAVLRAAHAGRRQAPNGGVPRAVHHPTTPAPHPSTRSDGRLLLQLGARLVRNARCRSPGHCRAGSCHRSSRSRCGRALFARAARSSGRSSSPTSVDVSPRAPRRASRPRPTQAGRPRAPRRASAPSVGAPRCRRRWRRAHRGSVRAPARTVPRAVRPRCGRRATAVREAALTSNRSISMKTTPRRIASLVAVLVVLMASTAGAARPDGGHGSRDIAFTSTTQIVGLDTTCDRPYRRAVPSQLSLDPHVQRRPLRYRIRRRKRSPTRGRHLSSRRRVSSPDDQRCGSGTAIMIETGILTATERNGTWTITAGKNGDLSQLQARTDDTATARTHHPLA